jgi:hypothetical protein
MKPAAWYIPSNQACYVPFAPRPGKSSHCLFVVNTPDKRTGRRITELDVQLACSASGLPWAERCNDHIFTICLPNKAEAYKALRSVRLTIPSTMGEDAIVNPGFHRPCPPKTFSCNATLLNIDHATVAARVLDALRGTRKRSPTPFDLLRQEEPGRVRYLLRFRDASPNPAAPWVQCFYIPMDDDARRNGLKVWAVFTPENISDPCVFCGGQCQRAKQSTCPFTKVIASQ